MKRFLFYSKKTVCLLLVLILTAAFVPAVYAAEPEDALMKGTFTMTTFDGFDPGEQTFYYSDSYFSSSGKKSNEHLRTMSAALVFPLMDSYYTERKDGVLLGDADGDGEITISDATMIQKYIADYNMPDNFQITACDVNGDGSVKLIYTTLLKSSVFSQISAIPIILASLSDMMNMNWRFYLNNSPCIR